MRRRLGPFHCCAGNSPEMNSLRAAGLLAVLFCSTPERIQPERASVDCDAGASITTAIAGLKAGDTLVVSGTCAETVVVPPETVGITIAGQGKATIRHPTGGNAVGSA